MAGCSSGHYTWSSDAADKTDLTFAGIPTILGAGTTGTTFPVTEHLSLTAKHVAHETFNTIVAEHPDCDVALIEHDNTGKNLPKFKNAMLGDTVRMYGHSLITSLPVESKGRALQNVTVPSEWANFKCILTTSSAGGIQGMSGGPVYSEDGKIVGIMVGVNAGNNNDFNTVFVPYVQFQKWLKEHI